MAACSTSLFLILFLVGTSSASYVTKPLFPFNNIHAGVFTPPSSGATTRLPGALNPPFANPVSVMDQIRAADQRSVRAPVADEAKTPFGRSVEAMSNSRAVAEEMMSMGGSVPAVDGAARTATDTRMGTGMAMGVGMGVDTRTRTHTDMEPQKITDNHIQKGSQVNMANPVHMDSQTNMESPIRTESYLNTANPIRMESQPLNPTSQLHQVPPAHPITDVPTNTAHAGTEASETVSDIDLAQLRAIRDDLHSSPLSSSSSHSSSTSSSFLTLFSHKQEVSPRLTYYVPTGKCPNTYFCRAEMTAYKQFMGKTIVTIGYSVWNFWKPQSVIPPGTVERIQKTSDKEIATYIKILAHAIGSEYPNPDRLCHVTVKEAFVAFKTALKHMTWCKVLKNSKCEQTVRIAAC